MGALCLFRTSALWECGVSRKVPVSKYRQGGILSQVSSLVAWRRRVGGPAGGGERAS